MFDMFHKETIELSRAFKLPSIYIFHLPALAVLPIV